MKVKCSNCEKVLRRSKRDIERNKTGKYFCGYDCRSKFYRASYAVECVICGKEFDKSPADQERYPVHCCSIECRSANNDKRQDIECANCKKKMRLPPSKISGRSNVFCSKECADSFQTTKKWITCSWCGKPFQQHLCIISRCKHNSPCCSRDCAAKLVYKESFIEKEFEDLIKPLGLKYERNCRTIVSPMELDFWLPGIKYAVEINGICHYEPIYGEYVLEAQKARDRLKRRKCKQQGIKLRVVKPGNCSKGQHIKRFKRVVNEIRKRHAIMCLDRLAQGWNNRIIGKSKRQQLRMT